MNAPLESILSNWNVRRPQKLKRTPKRRARSPPSTAPLVLNALVTGRNPAALAFTLGFENLGVFVKVNASALRRAL
jgi:hypothetical protein